MKYGIWLMAGMVLLGAGCETMPWDKGGNDSLPPMNGAGMDAMPLEPGLMLSSQQRFSDVPVPVGVEKDATRSYVYQSDELEIGRLVYTTRSSVVELAQFYIREAPAAKWKLEQTVEGEGAQLIFTKPGKQLVVTIEDRGPIRGRRLTLNLTPEE